MRPIETLTSVQEAAIAYLHSRPTNATRRVRRTAASKVRSWCLRHGYTDAEAAQAVRDMFDVFVLESNAE